MKMNNNTHAGGISVTVCIHRKAICLSDYEVTGVFHLRCRRSLSHLCQPQRVKWLLHSGVLLAC